MNSFERLIAFSGLTFAGPDQLISITDPDGTVCGLNIEQGRVSVEPNPRDECHLEVRSSEELIGTLLTRASTTAASRIFEATAHGCDWASMFPFDITRQPSDHSTLPNANATIQVLLSDSPVGPLRFVDEFHDGRLVARTEGHRPRPDVLVEASYISAGRFLSSGQPFLNRIRGWRIHSRTPAALQLVAGLYDMPEIVDIHFRRQDLTEELVRLAELVNSPEWIQRCRTK